jgi:hypothetical protein
VKLAAAFNRAALPAPPPVVNWYDGITFPMFGNDYAGDCVPAEQGHHEQVLTTFGLRQPATFTDAQILGVYSAITGYDPNDPSTDQGTVIQDAMNYWRRTGVVGHKITAFAEVNVQDVTEVRTALALFGPLSIGVNFPASAMDQFNAGEPWDVVRNDGGIEGGHCVALVGYDATYYYVVTWGAVQKVTPAWWRKYVEEAWTPLSREWINAQTGLDPEGVDLSALGDQFASLTGQANPFPAPNPGPNPNPDPTPPGPAPAPVDGADRALAAAVRPWLRLRHRGTNATVARELTVWLASKGL